MAQNELGDLKLKNELNVEENIIYNSKKYNIKKYNNYNNIIISIYNT